jgi:hypothetical protein
VLELEGGLVVEDMRCSKGAFAGDVLQPCARPSHALLTVAAQLMELRLDRGEYLRAPRWIFTEH